MFWKKEPPKPIHVPGTQKGEELAMRRGREPGRDERDQFGYRAARDSTSINPQGREPIDPRMPNMPPA
jgi:hypothetical protein